MRGLRAWTAPWSRRSWTAAPPWATFRQITLPQLLPAIVASLLLAFTFGFDDFVIAFFVAGSNTTLPIYVFASIQRGVTPKINAIGTLVLDVSSLMVLISHEYTRHSGGIAHRRRLEVGLDARR